MSIQSWADSVHAEPEHQGAVRIVQKVLERSLEVDDAAHALASIYEPLLQSSNMMPSPVCVLWTIIFEAARTFGRDIELSGRLVDLINAISTLPDVKNKDGKLITGGPWGNYLVYWRELPNIAVTFREYGIDVKEIDVFDEEGGDLDAEMVILLNATTFGAMYWNRGRVDIGMWFHAEGSLGQLESAWVKLKEPRAADMYFPPAATWILLAGGKIYKHCKENFKRTEIGSQPGNPEFLWQGGLGFSLEKWAFWKNRFIEIANTKDLKDNIKDIAAKAASQMQSIEIND